MCIGNHYMNGGKNHHFQSCIIIYEEKNIQMLEIYTVYNR